MRSNATAAAAFCLALSSLAVSCQAAPAPPRVTVEVEDQIYTYTNADNGAGPLWCYGSTCITRIGEDVFVSGLETIPDLKPYNNVRWTLYKRTNQGWELQQKDDKGRTREPCPIASFPGPNAKVFISANPTLAPPEAQGGPARPEVLEFSAANPQAPPTVSAPGWAERAAFDQHSYRGFAADGPNRELLLLNILNHDAQFWCFRDRSGQWSANGKLVFPWGGSYEVPQAIRLCYPEVALRDRVAAVFAVSDIVEPVKAWREYKRELTKQDWDYDFRQVYFCSTPDISSQPFSKWIYVGGRERTCGHASNLDLYIDAKGDSHLLWSETTVDGRLRDKFFPGVPVQQSLRYAVVHNGRVINRRILMTGGEKASSESPGFARFHVTPDGRLFVVSYVGGSDAAGKGISENRLTEITADGKIGATVKVPMKQPFSYFMTATPRGGALPSEYLDLYCDTGGTLRYARVKVE
jgi:hypothetical protein